MTTILFWDIDGTLLTTGRAGIFALEDAARDIIGKEIDLSKLNTAGATDCLLASQILELGGITPDDAKIDQLLQVYGEYLPQNLTRKQGKILEGVKEILSYLHPNRNDVVSLLLTGNTSVGAKAKLTHYGLDNYFNFTQGGFSDKLADRKAIARQALTSAQELVGEINLEKVYVIGDTPHDISCCQAIGAKSIAVATGSYRLEELQQHNPWWAIPSLPTPDVFTKKIGLGNV
ncbi:MAG: HAD hydrolase-like protein [Okeania sp. SIO3I5]|uniref:HAD family hydrolase n=1 Tax=Okeania sp. SIO3I5 TaxID=2607805 RepID=UPI0013B64077|nr:HAD hydrolase-like protein [Okeania sp. SIO3I5]NEQ41163.1 HAD hydrolase-like protein [Okeania sp. SIO3I5]